MTWILIALALFAAVMFGRHTAKQERKDFETAFCSQFAGPLAIFCEGPNDSTVEERAEKWREKFAQYGNKKAIVVAYPYNRVLDSNGKVITTITSDYVNTMATYCRNYLEITNNLHLLANDADPLLAARMLAGQQMAK